MNKLDDNKVIKRCAWCSSDPLYIAYHDHEWGVPVYNDQQLFEMLILEGAQAGLSWLTVLRKREHYRQVFHNFDVIKVAAMTPEDVERLMQYAGIIRNRLKINSAIRNARVFILLQQQYGSFNKYLWAYVDNKPIINNWQNLDQCPAHTPLSDQISQDLKKAGMNFVGSTIIYAYLQSIGVINDHLIDCHYRMSAHL
ncbi:DNA-3-methyladenine glycosylase [Gammaproteobacteria bacterium]|nr:DNA-3-methyladenine glycosylase [Gammaproteobacteria bacterium]